MAGQGWPCPAGGLQEGPAGGRADWDSCDSRRDAAPLPPKRAAYASPAGLSGGRPAANQNSHPARLTSGARARSGGGGRGLRRPVGQSRPSGRTAGRCQDDLQESSLKTPEFTSSLKKKEEHLAKLFDEILLQVLSKDPYYTSLVEGGTAITRRHLNENDLQESSLKTPEFTSSLNKKEEHLAKLFDLIAGKKKDKQASLFHRAVTELSLTTVDKESLHGTVSQEARDRNLPCGPLLHFLQKNIIVAALAAVAILAVIVLLLLMLATYIRRKQPLHPAANMTYNIFIMNGKTWWQKSPEADIRKILEKQKQLRPDSCA
ncbi:uncharacterized protein C2orf92 homolog [Marmota flaviventris]|uniref:uncharacterized protein C2orf92 homolog n=1 Tax=Marmota flaviventris TaxID=93162 RepID=UPI003A87D8CB